MALNIWPVDPARLRELEAQTLSRDTRMKLLFNGNAFDGDKIEPRRHWWNTLWQQIAALLITGFLVWLAWEWVRWP